MPTKQTDAAKKPTAQIKARALVACGFLMGTCTTNGHQIPLVLKSLMKSVDRLPANSELEAELGIPLEMMARSLMNAGRQFLPLHLKKRRRK